MSTDVQSNIFGPLRPANIKWSDGLHVSYQVTIDGIEFTITERADPGGKWSPVELMTTSSFEARRIKYRVERELANLLMPLVDAAVRKEISKLPYLGQYFRTERSSDDHPV